jgi:hypothetical protein
MAAGYLSPVTDESDKGVTREILKFCQECLCFWSKLDYVLAWLGLASGFTPFLQASNAS